MITTLLIANRGEIACRIMRTAQRMGIKTIAVYSEADAKAQHVKLADEAFCIGAPSPAESYLNIDKILDVAVRSGADAIHPGYGFLSENAVFAERCTSLNIIFLGPSASAIAAMGSKSEAKTIMTEAGVPLVPGYHGTEQAPELLYEQAQKIGFPVLLKAVAGGGGKGMRIVHQATEFHTALAAAKREAASSFGNDHMLVEKYVVGPRHIEIQVFFDSFGNGVYLHDRDCSVQRRYQKIIEEAPAPGLRTSTRQAMGEAAIAAGKAIGYIGAGTVEFLLDADEQFYFMEMNTRLQVEHPVTEAITGQDLVQWQIHIGNGEPVPLTQSSIAVNGHAFEARIYAEDPANEFLPDTGVLQVYHEPSRSQYVRVDSGVVQGDEISVYYDPMISKVITHADDRNQARLRLEAALSDYHIEGCATNIAYLLNILRHPTFINGAVTTHFIDDYQQALYPNAPLADHHFHALAAYLVHTRQVALQPRLASSLPLQWRNNLPSEIRLQLSHQTHAIDATLRISGSDTQVDVAEHSFDIVTEVINEQLWRGSINNQYLSVHFYSDLTYYPNLQSNKLVLWYGGDQYIWCIPAWDIGQAQSENDTSGCVAPMNGRVVSLGMSAPFTVKQGDTIMVIEAMKMEHNIRAPQDGVITEYLFSEGDLVEGGQVVAVFE